MSGASSGKGGSSEASSRQGERSNKQARRQARAKREGRSAESSEAASEASRAGERSASEQRGERVWYYASEASKVRACIVETVCSDRPHSGRSYVPRSRLTTDLVRVLYID